MNTGSKTANLTYGKLNADNTLDEITVNHAVKIPFLLNIQSETVVFSTKQRFGYKEFNTAFEAILNKCMEEADSGLSFTVSLRTSGTDFNNIKAALNQLSDVTKVTIVYQPPNPQDEIDAINESAEKRIEELKEANASLVTQTFEAKGSAPLNTNSELINGSIQDATKLHSHISTEAATSRGYVRIDAVRKSGATVTTSEGKPITYVIPRSDNFFDACKRALRNTLNKFL